MLPESIDAPQSIVFKQTLSDIYCKDGSIAGKEYGGWHLGRCHAWYGADNTLLDPELAVEIRCGFDQRGWP